MIKLFYGIDEPLIDPKLDFFDNIKRWQVLSVAAQMKKDNPEFGKAVETARKADKDLEEYNRERAKKAGLDYYKI